MTNKQSFDVIITTYNRIESLEKLVKQILDNPLLPEKIIIVDASNNINEFIQTYERVLYVHSSHGNQPYQRYVGFLASKSDILIYLDDDMEILDQNVFAQVVDRFTTDHELVALGMNFTNHNVFLKDSVPVSKLQQSTSKHKNVFNFLKRFSGNPELETGGYWLCGIKGSQPSDIGQTYWLNGGVFAAKRGTLYKNFNFKLFDIYENKLGKGEDGILGYTLSRQGKVLYRPKKMFYHNDQQDSVYTPNLFTFGKRVAYSRLYLSFEYGRLNNMSKSLVLFHYNWYMLWRLFGMLLNQIISFKTSRSSQIKGYVHGWILAIKDVKKLAKYKSENHWEKEAINDINR